MNRKGFTLIELLVVASLFVVGVASFGYLLKIGSDSVSSALTLNQVVYTLQSKMEEIRILSFDQLLALDGNLFAQGKGKVGVAPVLVDLVSIRLELEWDPLKAPLKLYALRSKYP